MILTCFEFWVGHTETVSDPSFDAAYNAAYDQYLIDGDESVARKTACPQSAYLVLTAESHSNELEAIN